MRVSGHRISIVERATGRSWQVAVLTAAGVIGFTSPSDAALYYWQDNDPGYYRPMHPAPQRKRARRAIDKKNERAEKETGAKPVGPLIIAISVEKQRVRVYDANGLFAESPVSTGTKTHPTPMGVFSIIQKHKIHHSNIYSGAPMPYMQRITWSGVAMHQGVLPGYAASHGCIRMPMAFAVKMWNWTKMGARVLVTPGEMTPASFSHPLLVTQKAVPVANDAPQVDAPLGVKSDKGADAKPVAKPMDTAEINLELRSTVGHAPLTQTADASGAMPANAVVTMSDASPAAASGEAISGKTLEVDTAAKAEVPKVDEAKPETAKPEIEQASAKSVDTAASDEKPADTKPAELVTGEIKPAVTTATDSSTAKAEATAKSEETVEPKTEAKTKAKAEAKAEATAEVAKPEAPKVEATKPEAAKPETVKSETAKAEPAKADEPKAAEQPAAAKAADAPDAKKDPSRLPGVAKGELKREGQIAVLISRKDGKLYVRQNFKPVFDVPVTIAPSERLLGTHVFTAAVDKNDPNLVRWSVVSMPVTARNAQKNDEDERSSRRRKAAAVPAETKPMPVPNTPAEALDRITVPQEVMARISEALTSGGSIVVSDQSINAGGETGEGTDFIVKLR
jgi:lipoprotein-anchoring transpeptidase ErfK/SrfK